MKKRKQDHLRICSEEDVEAGDAGFNLIRLNHRASPEIDLADISTEVSFLGKKLAVPLIFEAITGGTPESSKVNRTLAKIAQDYSLGMGVGSQRAAIENPRLESTYVVRDVAADILLIANLGAVQLNYGYGIRECRKAVDMIGADALALHLNPLQEVIQPEGNTNFTGIIEKINKIASELDAPLIVKEVGCGIDLETAKKLKVAAIDVAGMGGTSWSLVESYRNHDTMGSVGVTYSTWGTPTVECLLNLSKTKTPIIASGGIRNGLDAAKAVALGADVAGVALPLLRAYSNGGEKAVRNYVERFIAEFRTAMYLTGCRTVRQLQNRGE
jgi:isopentenyl-diphosphate Delta-isomerase